MRLWRWVFAGLMLVQAGQAACVGGSLSGVAATQTFVGGSTGYNPFDAVEYVPTVSFNVDVGIILVGCTYFVALGTGQSGNGNARVLKKGTDSLTYGAYTATNKTNMLLPAASAGASNVITGSFGVLGLGQTKAHTFAWSVPTNQLAPYGTGSFYSDAAVSLDLYEGTVTGTKTLLNSVPITFRTQVISSVNVAVTGSGGAFAIGSTNYTVPFGTVTSGAVRNFDMVVRSTDGYRLAMQSANAQKLKHATSSVTTRVPYTVKVSSVAKDLSGGGAVNVANYNGATLSAGVNVPVQVTIGTLTGNEVAGVYSDTLTVTVSAY